ncbi:hypothetical protein AAF712_009547 [Marasmius tenuissimus]|uniref:DUF6589 domain-containing protein n=1 Tax=Marasmius tenuissimus TaxID=585030 RepID=A0ABR2ZPF4_9AGAR
MDSTENEEPTFEIPRKRKARNMQPKEISNKPKRKYERNLFNPTPSFTVQMPSPLTSLENSEYSLPTPRTPALYRSQTARTHQNNTMVHHGSSRSISFDSPSNKAWNPAPSMFYDDEPFSVASSAYMTPTTPSTRTSDAFGDFSYSDDTWYTPDTTIPSTSSLESPFVASTALKPGTFIGWKPEVDRGEAMRKIRLEKIRERLRVFDHHYSPWELFEDLLTLPEFELYQRGLYRADSGRLESILDGIWNLRPLQERILKWFRPFMLEMVRKEIDGEFDGAKSSFFFSSGMIGPEWLESWDFKEEMVGVREKMPVWNTVLDAATEPPSKEKNVQRKPTVGQHIITSQALHLRSQNCSMLQNCMGLFSLASGASQQMVEVLSKCSLSTSRATIKTSLASIAKKSVEQAARISLGPHIYTYDNYNDSTSIHVEQRPDAPSKVQSGTLPLIYRARFVKNDDHFLLKPILENLRNSRPVRISDIRPRYDQAKAYHHQCRVAIIKVLFEYYPDEFDDSVQSNTLLQYIARRQLPSTPKTEFYALEMALFEEASTEGNLNVHVDSYIHQMKHDPMSDALNTRAIPIIGDQLTNCRVRGTQLKRANDDTPWERREILQIGIAPFHLDMNARWCVSKSHYGMTRQEGSLAYYFALMGKTRLGSDKPDYHALGMSLFQILDGLILDAWRLVSGAKSFKDFLKSKPDAATLYNLAGKIIADFATPLPPLEIKQEKKPGKAKGKSPGTGGLIAEALGIIPPPDSLPKIPVQVESLSPPSPPSPPPNPMNPADDLVRQNVRLLVRDLLYLRELKVAISSEDVGRFEDILPDLAAIFRGSGSCKYAMEIVYYLNNLMQVWPPDFANIMRDNCVVNIAGLPGHGMGIDMNIEHTIAALKAIHASGGKAGSWDRLGDISASIRTVQGIKEVFRELFETSYQKKNHTEVDTRSLVEKVRADAAKTKVQEFVPNRVVEGTIKATVDTREEGYFKLRRTTIPKFNKNMQAIISKGAEESLEDEPDEILPMNFSFGGDEAGETTVQNGREIALD